MLSLIRRGYGVVDMEWSGNGLLNAELGKRFLIAFVPTTSETT